MHSPFSISAVPHSEPGKSATTPVRAPSSVYGTPQLPASSFDSSNGSGRVFPVVAIPDRRYAEALPTVTVRDRGNSRVVFTAPRSGWRGRGHASTRAVRYRRLDRVGEACSRRDVRRINGGTGRAGSG